MSSGFFATRLNLDEHLVNGESVPGEWVLLKDLVYVSRSGVSYRVPRGFITDLASIPKPVRGLLDVNDKHRRAAVLHDYLYCVQGLPRAEVDALFLEAMEAVNVQPWKRKLMWAGVRVGGWMYWNKRARENDTEGDFVPDGYFSEVD